MQTAFQVSFHSTPHTQYVLTYSHAMCTNLQPPQYHKHGGKLGNSNLAPSNLSNIAGIAYSTSCKPTAPCCLLVIKNTY